MADNQITPFFAGFVHNLFSDVKAEENAIDDIVGVSDLEPGIIVRFLKRQRSEVFDGFGNVFDSDHYELNVIKI